MHRLPSRSLTLDAMVSADAHSDAQWIPRLMTVRRTITVFEKWTRQPLPLRFVRHTRRSDARAAAMLQENNMEKNLRQSLC
jgi:hypothetical protein